MPTVQGTDTFAGGDFTVPGSGPYSAIFGTPTKDTTILQPGTPASLLIDTSATPEAVEHAISGLPTMAWMGFWWRVEAGAEPAADTTLASFDVTAGARAKLTYQSSEDRFYHFWDGGSAQANASGTYEPGEWVWIEIIADVSTSTRTMYSRYGGVDIATPATVVTTSTTFTNQTNGPDEGTPTVVMRYSYAQWGTAASSTDWQGEPVTSSPSDNPPHRRGGRGAGW